MPVEGVIFDLGWTLIRYSGEVETTRRAAHRALVDSLMQDGVVPDAASFLKVFHQRLEVYERQRQEDFLEFTMSWVVRRTLSDLGLGEVSEAQLARGVRALYGVIERYWEPRPEALAVLDELSGMGLRMAILSNAADESDVRRLIAQCGFDGRFHPILISAALGLRKPNPRVFAVVLSEWGVPADRVVMVGDTLGADVLGAQNAGVHNIWIDNGLETPDNMAHRDTIHPEYTARELREIPAIIRSIP
jgi:putative hydrolase of the HAD superfamily